MSSWWELTGYNTESCVWRVPSDTFKTLNVDFEKEEAHCIRYKRLFVSSISNSQYLCSVSQNFFSRWSHSAVLGLRTNTLIAKSNTGNQNAFENVCHEPIINDHSLQFVLIVRFCLLHTRTVVFSQHSFTPRVYS
jgi:hypothetical protein